MLLRLFLAAACCALGAASAATRLYRVPVPMNVEGTYVQTSLGLVLEMELYGEPLAKFDARELDAHETAFRDFAEAIRANRPAALGKLLQPRPKVDPKKEAEVDPAVKKATRTVVERSDAPDAVLGMYRAVFNNFADLQVVARIALGDRQLFLWRSPGGKMAKLRGFLTQAGEGGAVRVSEMSMEYAVETFIMNSLGELNDATFPKFLLGDSKLEAGRYRLALGNSSAALEFAGQPMAVDAYDMTARLEEPASTYRTAWSAFKAQRFDEFLKFMAPESRQRFAKWLESVKAEGTEAFYRKASGPRFVRFVLNADPVYLIFVAPTKDNNWNPGAMQFDYMYRNGVRFEMVNAAFRTFFDDITKNNSELEALIRDAQPVQPAPPVGR